MKTRTKKLAWLLAVTMAFTGVNPGMAVMASEENEVTEQSVEEFTESDEDLIEEEDAELFEGAEVEEGGIEELPTAETEGEQLLMADEEAAEAVTTYADKSWFVEGEKEITITGYTGSRVQIGVKVNNSENVPLTYHWGISYHREGDKYSDTDELEEETSATITARLFDNRRYRCSVSDDKGNVEMVTFYVDSTNTLQVPAYDKEITVKLGTDLKLTANVISTKPGATLSYKWTNLGDLNNRIEVGTEQTYIKKNFSNADAKYYGCEVTDGYSICDLFFSITPDSGLRIQAPERFEVENGETKTIPISVTTDMEPKNLSVKVQKFDSGKPEWVEVENNDFTKLTVTGTGEIQRYKITAEDGETAADYNIAVGPRALLDTICGSKETAKILNAGNAETVAIYGEADNFAYLKFVPQKAGKWKFYSKGIYGTACEAYDEKDEYIKFEEKEEDKNFIIEADLKANEVYYLAARFAGNWCEAYGAFEVYAELVSESNCQHQWSEATVTKKVTCTEDGVSVKRCSVCGEEVSINIPKIAHSFGAYQVTTAPTALAAGVQTRTCSVCGYKETSEIAKLPASVSLSATSVPLQVKQSVSLEKLITAMTTGDRLVSCSTSNKKIATVSNAGKVTGKAAGNAKITMTFASGITKTVTVKVQKKKVATSKITNVPGSITLKVKSTYKLSPVIEPISTKEKATYKTANKKIATVSKSGKITAKKAGKTTITVKVGKKSKKVKVTVKK